MCLVAIERRLRMRDGAKNTASIRRSRRSSSQSNDWHMCRRNRLNANDTYQQIAASEATLAHKEALMCVSETILLVRPEVGQRWLSLDALTPAAINWVSPEI